MEKLARFGLVAQGISFGLVAVLAIELALGKGGKATDREGALQTIAGNGIGRVLVFVLAFGFGAYALWRVAQVFLGHEVEEQGGRKKWGKRLSSLGKAAIYGALCWGRLFDRARQARWRSQGAGGDEGHPRLARREVDRVRNRTGDRRRRALEPLSRGLREEQGLAEDRSDERERAEARGLDGALRKLANAPYGTVLLSIVAAGLFAFGVFCLIQARYREV
jgi:hypothetical protein